MILAIDQGTTGTTCLVFDGEGRIAGRAYSEFEQHFPRPGWVEHDASEIWEVTRRVAVEAIADAGIQGAELDAIGITNQRETVVAWDPATRRAAPPRAGLAGPAHRGALRRAARRRPRGARPRADRPRHRPLLLRHQDRVAAAQRRAAPAGAVFGTIDSWLLFKLTGRHATDYTNASRTMLFDIRRLAWDEELCALLGVDPARCRSRCPRPTSTARRPSSAARCRWRGSPATSRRRCSARPATRPAAPRTPTGPAASSCSTPAPRRPSRARGC